MANSPERTRRRHVREKSVIDQMARDIPKKPLAEKYSQHSPNTSTGLPVEEQVRNEWDPLKGRPSHCLAITPQSRLT